MAVNEAVKVVIEPAQGYTGLPLPFCNDDMNMSAPVKQVGKIRKTMGDDVWPGRHVRSVHRIDVVQYCSFCSFSCLACSRRWSTASETFTARLGAFFLYESSESDEDDEEDDEVDEESSE